MLTKNENAKFLKLYRPDLTKNQIKTYLDYVYKHNKYDNRKRHNHHIIPKHYFKLDKTISKDTYEKLMKQNFSRLTIKQHMYAHKLLGDKTSINFISVYRTETYSEYMKEVRQKTMLKPNWDANIKISSRKTLLKLWEDKNYRKKMKIVQHNNMCNANNSTDFQYNKREKLIFDCLLTIVSHRYKYLTKETWEKFMIHNTPSYCRLLTKYSYILLSYTSITLDMIKLECNKIAKMYRTNREFYCTGTTDYSKNNMLEPFDEMFDTNRTIIYDFKHWSNKDLAKLVKINNLQFIL